MNEPMRLFVRQGWYYINFGRGKSKALRTRNKAEAEAIFRETKKEWLRGRLFHFEDYKKVTIAELSADYCQRSGVSKWTLKKDELSFKLLSDVIGNAQIRTITKEKIRQFKKACLARGASPITVNGYLRHLKKGFPVFTPKAPFFISRHFSSFLDGFAFKMHTRISSGYRATPATFSLVLR